ncbi:endonuclease III domain-containing protein [Hyperthermus butylicus]|uniref:EndoIII-related endonuclease n=1 Tax=Hyperthermus butylicus (strain DSM 5456 / JCM 9403 / PLM1-5) TaxID=415426 RepID=A2BJH7_HYPBU|nr:endonuclease III [Hyperthermus butylicus]ABM80138.1 putative EndoIII-related endonuclease [Hyperthermus butylicus DSM 5456]
MAGCSIANYASGCEVFERLQRSLRVDWRDYVALVAFEYDAREHPFAVLAGIILSQNTSDRNSIRAYLQLREMVGVSPEAVLSAPEDRLIEAIRPAGLARQKARALREAARRILEAGGEKVLLEMPWRELREFLLSIPGVGKKTADVFLQLVRKAPVFAVDTHAARIAKRWGLVGEKAGYDETSRALLEFFGPERSENAHRLLIALGRTYCRARNPRCDVCPLRDICPYPRGCSTGRNDGGEG